MNVILITRVQAVRLTRLRLPYHMNWYLVTGLQWSPNFGDYVEAWAGDEGLVAVVGKKKQVAIKATAA